MFALIRTGRAIPTYHTRGPFCVWRHGSRYEASKCPVSLLCSSPSLWKTELNLRYLSCKYTFTRQVSLNKQIISKIYISFCLNNLKVIAWYLSYIKFRYICIVRRYFIPGQFLQLLSINSVVCGVMQPLVQYVPLKPCHQTHPRQSCRPLSTVIKFSCFFFLVQDISQSAKFII